MIEELFKFTLMARDRSDYLVDHYSERKGAAATRALTLAAAVTEAVVAGMDAVKNEEPAASMPAKLRSCYTSGAY